MNGIKLAEMIVDAGYEVRSYSGRTMYGATCLGVAIPPRKSAFKLAAEVAAQAMMSIPDPFDFIHYLGELSVQTDTLGMDTIVYFPKVEWTPEMAALS